MPVILSKSANYKRIWFSFNNSKHGKYSFLGIKKEKNNAEKVNGVLFPVNYKDLINFDKRENPGYYRRKIDSKHFKYYLNTNKPIPHKIYTYVAKKQYLNYNKYPIMQTYLDIVIQGCLEYDKKFAKMFIETTDNWKPIYNDRKNKIYSNYKNITLNYKKIDNIFHQLSN